MKIVKARITTYPKKFSDPMPMVMVLTEGSTEEVVLFDFYPDELSFSPDEFVGLTVEEGIRLKFDKDVKYLRS